MLSQRIPKNKTGNERLMYSHTIQYQDKADLIEQLETLYSKLFEHAPLTRYRTVRARYPHLKIEAFSMRLKRFEGKFPYRRIGRKIEWLFVTKALDAWLKKPLKKRARSRAIIQG